MRHFLRPLFDRVVVKELEPDRIRQSGLLVPAGSHEPPPQHGIILDVGPGLDWSGNSHWGVTCPYDSCPEGAGPYVSISNPTYYVVAHELCHANNGNDELAADACAADHGLLLTPGALLAATSR